MKINSINFSLLFVLGWLSFLFCARGEVILTTLVTFNETNGALPMAGLLLAKDGDLYGTTYEGGAYMKNSENGVGYGTVFKISSDGKFSTLVSLTTGTHPGGNLAQTEDGNFYGTTLQGGEHGDGTVFKMTPDGKIATLYSFSADNENGWAPCSLYCSEENLYGVCGDYKYIGGATIFAVTPTGNITTLAVSSGRNNPRPANNILVGKDDNLYGVLTSGILFKVTPTGNFETTFFHDGTNGTLAAAAVIEGKNGKFFGLTTCAAKGGSILRMDASGKFSTFARISGDCSSGELIQATDGNFYGANPFGGKSRMGTVFQLKSDGTMTTLFEFNGRNGNHPNTQLVQGRDGNFYGTTAGGFGTGGTVFRLILK